MEAQWVHGFEALSSALCHARRKRSAVSGLSALQAEIIGVLSRGAVATVGGLAARLSLTKATVSGAVRVLEKKRLVTKRRSRSDGRRRPLSLSEGGVVLAARLEGYATPLEDRLAALSGEEKSALWLNLLSLLRGFETHGLAARRRMCLTCCHLSLGGSGDYFCGALQRPLAPADLRLDCGIHKRLEHDRHARSSGR